MASKKCKRCGAYKPLIGDFCAECLSVEAYQTNKTVDKMMAGLPDGDDEPVDESTFGRLVSFYQKRYEQEKKDEEAEPTEEEAYNEIFKRIMQDNNVSEADSQKFKYQLNYIVRKYLFHLQGGCYGLSTVEAFKKTHLGIVVERRGRWVVYRRDSLKHDGAPTEFRPEATEFLSTATKIINRYRKEHGSVD